MYLYIYIYYIYIYLQREDADYIIYIYIYIYMEICKAYLPNNGNRLIACFNYHHIRFLMTVCEGSVFVSRSK